MIQSSEFIMTKICKSWFHIFNIATTETAPSLVLLEKTANSFIDIQRDFVAAGQRAEFVATRRVHNAAILVGIKLKSENEPMM